MLKAQLHIHAMGDPEDFYLRYSPKQVIDKAVKLNFDVLAFTFHNCSYFPKDLIEYAKTKGILLIPGIEVTVGSSHILILGQEKIPKIKKITDLKKIDKDSLIIAPHPFYPKSLFYSLNEKLIENIDLFHGIELSYYYTKNINYNKKAIATAKKYNKTIIGTSDLHNITFMNKTYVLIDSKKNKKDIINAIKNNKVKTITKPLSNFSLVYLPFNILFKTLLTGNIPKILTHIKKNIIKN